MKDVLYSTAKPGNNFSPNFEELRHERILVLTRPSLDLITRKASKFAKGRTFNLTKSGDTEIKKFSLNEATERDRGVLATPNPWD